MPPGTPPWPAYVLELHHVDPSTKCFKLSQAHAYDRPTIEAEITKCMVLCANPVTGWLKQTPSPEVGAQGRRESTRFPRKGGIADAVPLGPLLRGGENGSTSATTRSMTSTDCRCPRSRVRAIPGLPVCIAIDPADLGRIRVHHWLTPIAEAELLKALQARQRPVIPMRP